MLYIMVTSELRMQKKKRERKWNWRQRIFICYLETFVFKTEHFVINLGHFEFKIKFVFNVVAQILLHTMTNIWTESLVVSVYFSKKQAAFQKYQRYELDSLTEMWEFGWIQSASLPLCLLHFDPFVGAFEDFLRRNQSDSGLGIPLLVGCSTLCLWGEGEGVFVFAWLFRELKPMMLFIFRAPT